jgi:hypothetical protein
MKLENIKNLFTGICLIIFFLSGSISEVKANLEDDSMVPFWGSNFILNESMLPVSHSGAQAEATFLFPPLSIVSVKNAGLNVTYTQGQDWIYANGKIKIPTGSRIRYLKDTDLNPPKLPPNNYPGDKYFYDNQIAVSYIHNSVWKGPIPTYAGAVGLPKTIDKLSRQAPLKILLYGDSISVGACSSGFIEPPNHVAPFLPVWGQLMVDELHRIYGSQIPFLNSSVGGWSSNDGISSLNTVLIQARNNNFIPDLTIIAFGMNDDASSSQSITQYKQNIIAMMNVVKSINNQAEFIIVSPMLANPIMVSVNKDAFKPVIQSLTGPGIVMADLTGVHQELLKTKSYADLTGNNINHPNDFLARWYAQEVTGLLVPPAKGYLDSVSCSAFYGWAGEIKNVQNIVQFYADGSDNAHLIGSITANQTRDQAVCLALGFSQTPCNHGFGFTNIPNSLKDGKPHTIDAYVKDSWGNKVKLASSGQLLNCTNQTVLPADLNSDGKINIYDYNILVTNFGKTGSPGFIPADISKDGKVNVVDSEILINNYGK